jgi:tRNA pseudouridine38-40 synthase
MRIALGVEYDGAGFAGWQWQPGQRTLQSALEAALSRVANSPVRVTCAGRTDAGVHATAQVVHFETDAVRTNYSWVMGSNSCLPADLRVTWAMEVEPTFHARTSAIARHYRYVILNRSMTSALHRQQLTWVFSPLDIERMQQAALFLIGEHDFSSFRAQGCQSKSPNRLMHFIHVSREEDRVIIDVCANAFLHHMVRNIAGTLIDVGTGKQPAEWVAAVLAARDRASGGVTAPPDGLYFAGIFYPEYFGLPRYPIFDQLPQDTQRFSPPKSN